MSDPQFGMFTKNASFEHETRVPAALQVEYLASLASDSQHYFWRSFYSFGGAPSFAYRALVRGCDYVHREFAAEQVDAASS